MSYRMNGFRGLGMAIDTEEGGCPAGNVWDINIEACVPIEESTEPMSEIAQAAEVASMPTNVVTLAPVEIEGSKPGGGGGGGGGSFTSGSASAALASTFSGAAPWLVGAAVVVGVIALFAKSKSPPKKATPNRRRSKGSR